MTTLVDNDARLRGEVIEELAYDPMVNVSDLVVSVEDGVVTLEGITDSYGGSIAAGQAFSKR